MTQNEPAPAPRRVSRRQLVIAAGLGGVLVLGGITAAAIAGQSPSGPPDAASSPTSRATPTATPTRTPTSTPSPTSGPADPAPVPEGGAGGGETGGGGGGGEAAPPAPAPAPPAPAPEPEPEPVVDQTRYVQTNGAYVDPGSCVMWAPYYTHDPGPGGTSVSSIDQPWTYENMGTYIQFYLC